MVDSTILDEIFRALKWDKKNFPKMPDHAVSRAAIVTEEAGNLLSAALKFKYEYPVNDEDPIFGTKASFKKKHLSNMRISAIQTAVTAIRFLEKIKDYENI